MNNDSFDSARQKRMREVFQRAARQGHDNGNGNPDLRKFEERLDRVRSKMKEHLARHTPTWVGRETKKLIEKHKGQLKPALSPKWVLQTHTSPAALAQKAFRNVEIRNKTRISSLNKIENGENLKLSNNTISLDSIISNKPRNNI